MVSDDILGALTMHQIPILAVGDHGQLPPVRGMGSLMINPDIRLERIHRQAEGNPIIALSARIRETGDLDDSLEDGSAFTIIPKRNLPWWIGKRFSALGAAWRLAGSEGVSVDDGIMAHVLISWTNKLRCELNHDVRNALGVSEDPPSAGEVVVCLKNGPPAYNGMRALLETHSVSIPASKWRAAKLASDLWFVEDGFRLRGVAMAEDQFFREKTIDYDTVREMGITFSSLGALYDFGYALTCHKMQGSQAADVAVVLEPGLYRMGREERTRWTYTAVTRAAERLTVIR
jgi:exodeoxyribonuclease-5